MPLDLVQRINLDLIHPEFRDRVLAGLAACRARGQDYYWIEGYRSYGRSFQLYQAYLNGGPRAAPAGKSGHNFGIAGDFCADLEPGTPGLQPSWDKAKYQILIEEMQRVGLSPGANYGDTPHIELPGFVTTSDLAPLDLIWKKATGSTLARLQEVWKYVDEHMPNIVALKGTQ